MQIMDKIEDQFLQYFTKRFPKIKAVSEFKVQKQAWAESKSELGYTDWIKDRGLSDFRGDFAILKSDKVPVGIITELDGDGNSHKSDQGIQRDRVKGNQCLKLGYVMLRFPVKTVKSNMAYVADEIMDVYHVFNGEP